MSHAQFRCQEETARWINAALRTHQKKYTDRSGLDEQPWILFTLKEDFYAISAHYVPRVTVLYELIPYKTAPPHCPGVIWDKEGMIRLLDLRTLLGKGDFSTFISENDEGLPMLVIVGMDGIRRGVIVDRLLMIQHPGNDVFVEYDNLIPFTCGRLSFAEGRETALIIRPEDLRVLDMVERDEILDWNGRVDMRVKAENIRNGDSNGDGEKKP